jgi:serine/threonine-protein kinase
MPPEQVLSEPVDARADIYSLGVVMFRVITGHLPFESERDLDMLAHQVLLPPPPPSWFFDGLDPRVDALVCRAMRKHPDNRYPDMVTFAADLGKLIDRTDECIYVPDAPVEPDVYLPKSELGVQTTLLFCQKLGVQPPWRNYVPGREHP